MGTSIDNLIAIKAFSFGTGKTWAEVATVTTSAQTVTVPGLEVGDMVLVEKPTEQTGLSVVGSRVSAKDTLTVIFMNPTAGGLTPTAEEAYKGIVFKPVLPVDSNATI